MMRRVAIWIRKNLWPLAGAGLLLTAGLTAACYFWLLSDLPDIQTLPSSFFTPSIRVTDRNGRLLYETLSGDTARHVVLPSAAIPETLKIATVATEDSRYYLHPGVDVISILRTLWINLRGGEALAGGSTITQQVARNLLLGPEERFERTLRRKLREGILAWQLARQYSKDEILALYLNHIYYGSLAYGVEAAAQTYFGKPAAQLDLAESALIAGLPQAPSYYDPFINPQAAKERQKIVLALMHRQGFISDEQRRLAEEEPLVFAASPYPAEALHFVLMVRSQIDKLYSSEEIASFGGLEVRTTLDWSWQKLAEEAVSHQIGILKERRDGIDHNVNNAALIALDPRSGAILALVGSPDYDDKKHGGAINMAVMPRQPGSAIKPLVYAVALDPQRDRPWTAATMILDVKTAFVTHDGYSYVPANYDSKEHGPVSVRQALASSLNIPAVIALNDIGLGALFDQANRMGITSLTSPADYDLSLALGGGEVSLIELSAAYAAFANGGLRVTPYSIQQVRDLQGNVLWQNEPEPTTRVLDERVAWLITDILSDDEARSIGFGRNSALNIGRPAAVKTGTTQNFHDNWTVGYTPDIVVGVWAGNTDRKPMKDVTGLTGAAPIWHQFIRSALSGQPQRTFRRPYDLTRLTVCAISGMLPTALCQHQREEWFIPGTEPHEKDTLFRRLAVDTRTGLAASEATPPQFIIEMVVLDLPLEAASWARQQGIPLLSQLLRETDAGHPDPVNPVSSVLQVISPPPHTIYRIAENYSTQAQKLQIEAVGEAGLSNVQLYLDGRLLDQFSTPPYVKWWLLEPGEHEVWAEAMRSNGEKVVSETITFEVRQ